MSLCLSDLSTLLFSTVLVLGFVSNAYPQTPATARTTNPTFELSAGYQYLHIPDQSFPFGLRTCFDEPDETEDSVNNEFRVFFGLRMVLD